EPAEHSKDPDHSSGSANAKNLDRWDTRKEVQPAPGEEVSSFVLGPYNMQYEISKEENADCSIRPIQHLSRAGGQRDEGSNNKEAQGVQTESQHEQFVVPGSVGFLHGLPPEWRTRSQPTRAVAQADW